MSPPAPRPRENRGATRSSNSPHSRRRPSATNQDPRAISGERPRPGPVRYGRPSSLAARSSTAPGSPGEEGSPPGEGDLLIHALRVFTDVESPVDVPAKMVRAGFVTVRAPAAIQPPESCRV
jgi:hypothetical protein